VGWPSQPALGGRVHFGGVGGQFPGIGEHFLAGQPFGEAAGAPFVEVLFAGGGPVELAV